MGGREGQKERKRGRLRKTKGERQTEVEREELRRTEERRQ